MKIQFLKLSILILSTLFLMPSCATLFSKRIYPVTINSTPSGALLEIYNRKNEIVYTGTTPAQVQLKAAAGYFMGEIYTMKFKQSGYEDDQVIIKSTEDPWFWVNIYFGELIGLLIVDPLSGAMYRIPVKEVNYDFKVEEPEKDEPIFDTANIDSVSEI